MARPRYTVTTTALFCVNWPRPAISRAETRWLHLYTLVHPGICDCKYCYDKSVPDLCGKPGQSGAVQDILVRAYPRGGVILEGVTATATCSGYVRTTAIPVVLMETDGGRPRCEMTGPDCVGVVPSAVERPD